MASITTGSLKESLRKAAKEQLFVRHKPVNVSVLARLLEMPRRSLDYILAFTMPNMLSELHIVSSHSCGWNQEQLFILLEATASLIEKDGQKPCPAFITAKLGWNSRLLNNYFKKYKELVDRLHLYSDVEASVWYAARKLRFEGEQCISLRKIATKARLGFVTVRGVFEKHPEWSKLLLLQTAPLKKRPVMKSEVSLLDWCYGRKANSRKAPASLLVMTDRIIFAVTERFQCARTELLQPGQRSKADRLMRLRDLTMYLLSTEAKLSRQEIIELFHNGARERVTIARKRIEPYLSQLAPELEVLRKLYCLPN